MTITPTPIPIDNLPEGFKQYVFGFFQNIIRFFRNCPIPFTHVTLWDFLIWSIIMAAVIKAIKLMYGKGDSTKHE